ncbi:uncharacterized protein C8Q71DRAFT_773269 [Rhodofomes roseus]|uniref:F-box domain-containing protein n=1 Tax=Rhodofomes roseus TaxID=34475 RepID=A0ABQ8K801_9APHY|nr:uncharacterized protein C8Q71DRAFT_773269 [Rhodofomes roseus]KAH9833416.1 hypothetical protein C8Q71DRAFT_773269 [Rhodofomes roseus]
MGNDVTYNHGYRYAAFKARTTVNDLPQDVLLIILHYVFSEERPYVERRSTGVTKVQHVPLSPLSRSVSDYSKCDAEYLASVCPLWRLSMSCSSIFWQQMVIWIGRDPTPLSRVSEYLRWSRAKPLQIYVLRRFDPSMEDKAEKAHVAAVIKLLLPHVKRWAGLSMQVLHSSSLPRPHFDLVGHAEELTNLKLDFVVDDAAALPAGTSSPAGEFDVPRLETLSMGGVHFRESYVIPFSQLLMPPRLRSVTLRGYTSPQVPFALADLLNALQACKSLRHVYLHNLQLDISVPQFFYPCWPKWDADPYFSEMSGDVIEEYYRILQYPASEQAHFRGCSGPVREHPAAVLTERGAYDVSFIDFASPTVLLHYLTYRGTSARVLAILEGSGLDADVLRALAKPTSSGGEDPKWLCPHLEVFHITGCKHFRSADLRAVLEARLEAHKATGFATEDSPGFVLRSVEELYVYDCGELAPEDKEWFDKNVGHVRWDQWRGGSW